MSRRSALATPPQAVTSSEEEELSIMMTKATTEVHISPKFLTKLTIPIVTKLLSLKNLQELSISCYDLQSFPDEIFSMTQLKVLKLPGYKFSRISSKLGDLVNLEILVLYSSDLIAIPREIGNLRRLRSFTPYTSYQLHYLPFEITRCPITDCTISTRALYSPTGGTRGNTPLPPLPKFPSTYEPLLLKEYAAKVVYTRKNKKIIRLPQDIQEYIATVRFCSVCRGPYFGDTSDDYDLSLPWNNRTYKAWRLGNVVQNRIAFMGICCSLTCVEALQQEYTRTESLK